MKFRLVDRITAWKPYERIRGVKAVSFEEYSLKEAFGEEGHLPALLLLESLLQLGNWLLLLSSDFQQMGMVIRIDQVDFFGTLQAGQQMQMEIRLIRRREEGFELSGEGRVNGCPVLRGTQCLAVPVPVKEYQSARDLRVVFEEIYHPENPP